MRNNFRKKRHRIRSAWFTAICLAIQLVAGVSLLDGSQGEILANSEPVVAQSPEPTAESPRPTDIPIESPRPTEEPIESPTPDVPVSTEPSVPPTIEPPAESPRPTDMPIESPRPTEEPIESPTPDVPVSTEPSVPPTIEPPAESPRPTDIPIESPRPTDIPIESPRPTDIPIESPTPDVPVSTEPSVPPTIEPPVTPEPTTVPTVVPSTIPTTIPTATPESTSTSSPSTSAPSTPSPSAVPSSTPTPSEKPSVEIKNVSATNTLSLEKQTKEAVEAKIGDDNTFKVDDQLMSTLQKENKALIITSKQASIEISQNVLEQIKEGSESNKGVSISLEAVSVEKVEDIQKSFAQNSTLTTLKNENAWISLNAGESKKENKQDKENVTDSAVSNENFKEPIKLTIDLGKVDVKDTSKLTLVKYVQKEDGTIEVVKLGGVYDPETGSFSGYVNEIGDYGVVVDENLKQVQLQIDNTNTIANGQENSNDVAPRVIEGQVAVPLRYVAESLGAEVIWDNKAKKTMIVIDGTSIVIDKEDIIANEEGRSLVSTELIIEKLGANLTFIPSTNEMIIIK